MFKLVSVKGTTEHLLDKDRVTVGRDQSCDIRIVTGKVSKRHAQLLVDGESVAIEDLDSTNGTYVNNRQISSRRTLAAGDVVRFESVAYYLSSAGDDDRTILAHNLPPKASDGSSSITIDAGSESTDTIFVQDYSLPADWPTAENDALFTDRAGKYTTAQVDELLQRHLPDAGDLTAVLLVMSGASASPMFGLTVRDRRHHWSIGRAPEQSISLGDVSVSARHATLIYDDGRWAIQDERSSNRVKVNNSTQSLSPLRDGDLISLGKVDLVFRLTG